MLRKFILNNNDRFLARWVIFIFDLLMVAFAYVLATFMRFNFDIVAAQSSHVLLRIGEVMFFYALGFIVSRSYVGIIRHTNLIDAVNIAKGASFALVSMIGLSVIETLSMGEKGIFYIPRSILVIHFLCTLFILIGSRLLVKYLYENIIIARQVRKTKVMIYGAGSSGLTTMQTLMQDHNPAFEVIGFIDDNPYKVGKAVGGVYVFSPEKVFTFDFISKHNPKEIIIAIQNDLSNKKRKDIVERCLELNVQVRIVPPIKNWIQGELSAKQIKPVRIEDLLERDPIVLDNVNISREIKGKVVMVTGAAGSIGSEIARQLLHYSPGKVVLLDQAESALYDLEIELRNNCPKSVKNVIEFVVGDVANYSRMHKAFDAFQPQIVFHAAAYKHVPLMENNPYEAVNVNIFGTKIIADLAVEYRTEKFVLVSTDKAVNPTNVMGATKRTAEIYTQSLGTGRGVQTQFIITRFGNVLGSNGSVIPLFKSQIEKGGPITVTDKRITRFFMTIPEACNLVLEAGAMGKGGEIFVFDMGESVKIYDLAKKMIKLSGLTLGKDIEIQEIGLRPGEKLYEELLAVRENTKPTYHPKILIAEVERNDLKLVRTKMEHLQECLDSNNNLELVGCLKKIVPEFISNNSIFASLDLKKIVNE